MEFGHIQDNLKEIDFTLPPDGESTSKTFNSGKLKGDLQIYVGAPKWAYKTWRGVVYSPKTPEAEYLTTYADNFNAVEFGASFYNFYSQHELSRWVNQVRNVKEFKFCPKVPQYITHIRRLANADEQTKQFYHSLAAFGENLGPQLLQLGDNFSPKSYDNLERYLTGLPNAYKVAVELRHKDWFSGALHRKRAFGLLRELNIGSVITDAAGRRDCVHMEMPTKDAFIRFVGNHLAGSDLARLNDWVERLKTWRERGLESVYFFVHHQNDRQVAVLCDYLIMQLNDELGLNIKRPTFL